MEIVDIARIAHEANRAFCLTLGDNSQPSWDDAPEWHKNSLIAGVQFHIDDPDATPADSHDSWLAQKEAEGWKYGLVKDPKKKEHPCFLPYDKLPPEKQIKDHLFRAIVHGLINFLDAEN